MRKTTLALLTMLGLTCTLPVSAQEYMFTYSKLYTQVKNNLKEGHDDVKVGVFFVNAETKQLCTIEKAWMEKEEHYEEFVIPASNELPLPIDNNLRSANPLVFVNTQEGQCDYSLVVMTKENLEGKVTYSQVEKIIPQMQTMLEDLSGMFSSWFTPEITGITLEFANMLEGQIQLSNGKVIPIEQGKAQLTLDEIGLDGSMQLPEPTQRVLPFISPQ